MTSNYHNWTVQINILKMRQNKHGSLKAQKSIKKKVYQSVVNNFLIIEVT